MKKQSNEQVNLKCEALHFVRDFHYFLLEICLKVFAFQNKMHIARQIPNATRFYIEFRPRDNWQKFKMLIRRIQEELIDEIIQP